MVFKFRTDFDKYVVVENFLRRGWVRSNNEDFHVYWANVHNAKQVFNPENNWRLGDHQLVNHFPNHYELTRKDLMVKNVKRFKKVLPNIPTQHTNYSLVQSPCTPPSSTS